MNKEKKLIAPSTDLSKYSRSTFTLTFAIEILGLEVWQDFKEGWLEQGPCVQGLKLQYQLYPGQTFEADILIWPHIVKIWCKDQYGWVRTWQFLERRWFCFSISHAFPVRVVSLHSHVVTITPTLGVGSFGANAKNEKNFRVYLPPLGFGVRRYFAPVLESNKESLVKYVQHLVWRAVEEYIPRSCFDDLFDAPHEVTDARHQDACLDNVRDFVLRRLGQSDTEETLAEEPEAAKRKGNKQRRDSTIPKEVKKVPENVKLEIRLPGESVLAGTGRIIPFESIGAAPRGSPGIIALVSSNNLPARDDLPIVFLNIQNLYRIPLNELNILRVAQVYTKWRIGDKEHSSAPQPLNSQSTINFKDNRALPIPYDQLSKITLDFLDNEFVIELRGVRLSPAPKPTKLFGYERGDRDFGRTVAKPTNENLDFLIAVTKIDTRNLAKGSNSFLRGEYPLFPPRVAVKEAEREGFCTNDINFMRVPVVPDLIVQPDVILLAQMSLEVSIGVVGCRTSHPIKCFSRMFCSTTDSDGIMKILRFITDVNDEITLLAGKKDELLSGFALDTGSAVILFVEGPKDGHLLRVWDMTQDFYPKVKPMFSCSDRYTTRVYSELLAAAVPFIVLKMFVPLAVLLACPPVYTRPALPLPTRSAVLKLGGLIGRHLRKFPARCQIPTVAELRSFRLELCVAPRPTPVVITDNTLLTDIEDVPRPSFQSVSRIIWDKK